MMTNKQLKALMEWTFDLVRAESLTDLHAKKVALYDAFGFVEGENGWPVVPHTCTCSTQDVHDYGPCGEECFSRTTLSFVAKHRNTGLATSDPEGHRQAITDAAAEDRISGLWALFNERWQGVPMTHRELAESLVCLWPELKAIMDPDK